ncbi:Molybdate-anion transporter [Orchesella cincta]|uniref:Molybdate-anion transporter n=1 Tax=Orchesella cincta TaxID=48709 RepID=A0A1D2MZI4_ORCCI|nr:Molybdate-anion transporter [Orchesella cincta]
MSFIDLTTLIETAFIPLSVAAYFLYVSGQKAVTDLVQNKEFLSFQNVYFLPYFMALFSDWLQGPYVYKLYSYYGFPQEQIAVLYVVGFASSVIFGTTTGPLADKFGRKKMVVIFCLLYSLCCLTKLSPNFFILLIGRILGGISTSILFSVFESWYIHEHTITWKYPLDWVSLTFSKATFFNGLLAIFAGIIAQISSDWMGYGPVSPFIIAMPFLIVASVIIFNNWPENYGERDLKWSGSCIEGLKTIMSNKKILALGLVQSLFESNMYIFVFLWTPVLEPGLPPIGLTFASFMIAIMIGSSVYSILLKNGMKSDVILRYCLSTMGISMLVCAITSSPELEKDLVSVSFLSFLLLEVSVGMYFPCIGRLRGETIPDSLRANIMNWFRVPMNIITCGALLGMHATGKSSRANQVIFLLCALSSFLGYLLSVSFSKIPKPSSNEEDYLKTDKHDVSNA